MSAMSAQAATYYIATTGSDTNPGTVGSPWQTFSKAAGVAAAGDTVIVGNGTYNIGSGLNPVNQGTAASPITYEAQNWHGVNISYNTTATGAKLVNNGKQYLIWQGFVFDPGAIVPGPTGPGEYIVASDGWQFLDCVFAHSIFIGGGLQEGGTAVTHGINIQRCVFSDIAGQPACFAGDTYAPGDLVNNVTFQDVVLRRANRLNGNNNDIGNKIALFTSNMVLDDLIDYDNQASGLWFDTDNDGWTIKNSTFFANHAGVNFCYNGIVTTSGNTTTTFGGANHDDGGGIPVNGEAILFISGANSGSSTFITSSSSGNLIVSPALPHAPANGDLFVVQALYPGASTGAPYDGYGFITEANDNGTFTNNVGYCNTDATIFNHSSGASAYNSTYAQFWYGGTGGLTITNNLFAYDGVADIFFWPDNRNSGGATITGNSFKFTPGVTGAWNNWGGTYPSYPKGFGINFDFNNYDPDANPFDYGWNAWYNPNPVGSCGLTAADVSGTSNDYLQNPLTWNQDIHSTEGTSTFDGTTGFKSTKVASYYYPTATDYTWSHVYYPNNTFGLTGSIHQVDDTNGASTNTIDAALSGHSAGQVITIPVSAHTPISGTTCKVYDLNGRWVTLTVNSGDQAGFIAAIPPYVTCTTGNATRTYNIQVTLGTVSPYNVTATYNPAGGSAPAAPTGLVATAGTAQATLSWTASAGATSYNVYRGTTAGGESPTPIYTGITGTTKVDTGLTNGTTYYYKVAAVNGSGTSGYSNEASATPITGSLTGTPSTAAASYNLTTLGTTDWRAWAVGVGSGNDSVTDDKSTGGGKISNYTKVNPTSGNYGTWNDTAISLNWTDGTPTSSATNEGGFLAENADATTGNHGYSFTVPADTTSRTLYFVGGGNNVTMSLTAHLSDGSATDYTNTQVYGATNTRTVYAITYHAASAGQMLTITLLKTANNGAVTNGSVNLYAAWL